MSMRGIGGPLLCIGDLLNDVGEEHQGHSLRHEASPSPSSLHPNNNDPPPHLTKLFQEHYDHLNSALSGTDHSWTSLTLKVEELQKIVKRGDSAIAAAKTLYYVTPDNHSSVSK
ncbi:hypothetical protein PHAVU_008G165400 [Phaseolus vulgaris]